LADSQNQMGTRGVILGFALRMAITTAGCQMQIKGQSGLLGSS
jgi:hypothetical protein